MRSKKKSKDTVKQIKMGTQQSKIGGTLGKKILRGKFIALQAYLKNKQTGKAQINNLNLHLKELEKEQQTNPKWVEEKK